MRTGLLAGEMRKSEEENGGWWIERMGKTPACGRDEEK
jgi:hypothetical protein